VVTAELEFLDQVVVVVAVLVVTQEPLQAERLLFGDLLVEVPLAQQVVVVVLEFLPTVQVLMAVLAVVVLEIMVLLVQVAF
jgi:hypothetical protein